MAANRLGGIRQILLLGALALCIAAMHHISLPGGSAHAMAPAAVPAAMADAPIAMADAAPTGSGEEHPGTPGGAHTMLHLCLAVLYAVGALVLALLAFRRHSAAKLPVPAGPRGSPVPGRPPDRRGRLVLASLCVLRT
ncbi:MULTISPECIES: hypothetical protein [Amycolatopsis]|uniref:Uncharacterized protein n=1 Tax=Amycolatopsis echigonensis TaxID=2576905 RepID=A0A2N3WLB4_9PSEU|nr:MULTISPECIES: hypothetical protein [Amycolatopsis]MBB2499902.1 hypothetical protein [Amycolatopsis echigonensis]MCG3751180.1 hypothetical protein [Amycolatopsis sp. Poz14]PKV94642.1 hypothetical protein ATK30_5522 [Amycolatopsis niigatensis]